MQEVIKQSQEFYHQIYNSSQGISYLKRKQQLNLGIKLHNANLENQNPYVHEEILKIQNNYKKLKENYLTHRHQSDQYARLSFPIFLVKIFHRFQRQIKLKRNLKKIKQENQSIVPQEKIQGQQNNIQSSIKISYQSKVLIQGGQKNQLLHLSEKLDYKEQQIARLRQQNRKLQENNKNLILINNKLLNGASQNNYLESIQQYQIKLKKYQQTIQTLNLQVQRLNKFILKANTQKSQINSETQSIDKANSRIIELENNNMQLKQEVRRLIQTIKGISKIHTKKIFQLQIQKNGEQDQIKNQIEKEEIENLTITD